jgi:hypothetical protein
VFRYETWKVNCCCIYPRWHVACGRLVETTNSTRFWNDWRKSKNGFRPKSAVTFRELVWMKVLRRNFNSSALEHIAFTMLPVASSRWPMGEFETKGDGKLAVLIWCPFICQNRGLSLNFMITLPFFDDIIGLDLQTWKIGWSRYPTSINKDYLERLSG